MDTNILQLKNISKTFPQAEKPLTVLNNISTTFEQGKTYAITGASGSGKSTLLHIIGGLDVPSGGTVLCNNENLAKMKRSKKENFLKSTIGFVFQFHYLINELTVLENIIIRGLVNNKSKKTCTKEALELLDHFGLVDKANNYPYHLSGGEQQRISIIRALFNQPDFLLADEPTGNLDAQNAAAIVTFFLSCQQRWKMGLVICSHDHQVYEKMETIYELKNGVLSQKTS